MASTACQVCIADLVRLRGLKLWSPIRQRHRARRDLVFLYLYSISFHLIVDYSSLGRQSSVEMKDVYVSFP